MAIEKNSYKVSRYPEYHLAHTGDTVMFSDDEDLQRGNSISAVESDNYDDQFDECDSGAGSDDFDLLELCQIGVEFGQVGDQTSSFPYELYDLPGFKDVLSMKVWNEVLTEEERFGLAKYLPDMDQENFVLTLKELLACDNLHFGSPVDKLFEMLKGGFCEPRVALYRQGLNFLQRRQHYHNIQKHQNVLVNNLCQMRDAWLNCRGYCIEEKLRVLNIKKCQKSLMNENMEEFGSESSDRQESGDDLWGKKAKDGKLISKTGGYSGYGMGPDSDISTPVLKIGMESNKHVKQNSKVTLKLTGSKTTSAKELADRFPLIHPKVKMKSSRYGLGLPVSWNKAAAGYDASAAVRINERMIEDDDEEEKTYEVSVHRDRNFQRVGTSNKSGAFKLGKKQEGSRAEDDVDSSTGLLMSARNDLHAFGRNKVINQLSDIKVLTTNQSNGRSIYDGGTKLNFPKNLQQFTAENRMKIGKGQKSNLSLKGSQTELLDGSDPSWVGKPHDGLFPTDSSYKHTDLNAKNKKWKKAVDLNANDKLLQSVYRAKSLQDKFQMHSMQNGGRDGAENRDIRAFSRSEETESDSSDPMDGGDDDDDDDDDPLMRSKWAYPGGVPDLKYAPDTKKAKLCKKDKKDSYLSIDGSSQSTRKMEDYGKDLEMINAEQKGIVLGGGDRQQFYPLGRNGHVKGSHGNRFNMLSLKSSFTPGKRPKGEVHCDFDRSPSIYMHDCNLEDDLFWTRPMAADNGVSFKLGKKCQMVEPSTGHHREKSGVLLMGCNALSKKRKMMDDSTYMNLKDNNDDLHDDTQLLIDDVNSLRKHGKNKLEDAYDVLENGISEPPSIEMEMEMEDVEAKTKPQNKPFPLITPTVLTGFSFSIIHLLSAVRMAMITMLPEDSSEAIKHPDKNDAGQGIKEEQDRKQEDTNAANAVNSSSDMDVNTLMPSSQENVPPLAVQEIVNRVRSNPGDPCILERQEPLQDLVRGVLKIFSSRTAPLGAKGWKSLVVYEKSTKRWSWIGPVAHNISDSEVIEEVTSPDAWGLPHKMLVKLVDSFANWLKNSQDTLQQIGSLPAPPLILMQNNLDEKERFKDLRAQKSLSTISPNSEEVRAYFQKEEVLRYLIPDRAFTYTAVDGKKTIVAPLRRCGGKPASKARDHFMLKRDRPPHVTILCLVRDAAARLPGSIGTRADVCTLIRDSQYIVEDVSDAQVNQVVSGALDRLHYERDPCVQFDGERKLWVYLHREREEEDFEDDGTSSTKKWRRQKKEVTEPSDQGSATIAFSGPLEQSGFDLVSDLNAEALCAEGDKGLELDYHNGNGQVQDNAENSHGSDHGLHHDPTPVILNDLGLTSMGENKLLCQDNSINEEDFDEDTIGGEPPA